jgi:short-subunit dehydrogenase
MKIVISGATGELGGSIVLDLCKRFPQAYILAFGRDEEKLALLREKIKKSFPDRQWPVFVTQGQKISKNDTDPNGDISTEQDRNKIFNAIEKRLGGVDMYINTIGLYKSDSKLDVKSAQELRETNFTSNASFTEELISRFSDGKTPLVIADIGTIGAVAELVKKPLEGTTIYGESKARLVEHTMNLAKNHENVFARIVHPGPFGASAQKIADEFGDCWAMKTEDVANFSLDLFFAPSKEKIVQGIICAEPHFFWGHIGDIDMLGIEGLTMTHSFKVRKKKSMFLVRKDK